MRNFLMAMVMLFLSSSVYSQTWGELVENGGGTYVGGLWAATSYACLGTNYTDDSGSWASGDAMYYRKGCFKALLGAFIGNIERPEQ